MATLTARVNSLEQAMHEQFAVTLDGFKSAVRVVIDWIDANGTDEQRGMFERVEEDPALLERLAYTSHAPADMLDKLTQAWDAVEVAERTPAFERWARDTGRLQA